MKMMKLALLGGAALAVSAIGAQADELDALKAEIEALNARVAQLEATPSVPAGYQLVTITKRDAMVIPGYENTDPGYGSKATVISILPTADAPSSTSIEWSGYARAALTYVSDDYIDLGSSSDGVAGDDADADVLSRGQLKVVGKTDTAVGEVGATVSLRANADVVGVKATFVANDYWGWWAMTPELTLGGGYTGSLGNIGYGYDGACTCYYTDNADVALNPGDASQMRLSWASGPISAAVAVEDASVGAATNDSLGAAGEVKYSGDMVNGEISGVWKDGGTLPDDLWQVGAGAGFALGDFASISIGAAMGHVYSGDDWWSASILASMNLSDTVHAEASYGMKDYDVGTDVDAALAGIYYDPVSQLTIGVEGEWINPEGGSNDYFIADLVTVFRF